MAITTSGILGMIFGWFSSLIFWIIVLILMGIVGFIALKVRKKRALIFTVFEVTFLKDGKQVIEEGKAGWFGRKKAFFGLLDVGKNKIMKMQDGRTIHEFSVDDYHEHRKKNKQRRCLIVTAHPEDKSIVVPIARTRLDGDSLKALYEIAPADYREAAVEAFNESAKELRGQFDRVLPYILLGGIIIFFIVGIIINGQLISKSVDSAETILRDAGTTLENIAQLISTAPSSTAP